MPDDGAPASVCPEDDALATFAQGIGSVDERARVDEHLRSCAACADVLAAMGDTYGSENSGRAVGRYELVTVIGRGGMGVVHEARDPLLARRVAVKVLHASGGEAVEQQRLLREARAMARVAHPNVVTVYDAGLHDGRVFVTMQLVRGPSLREHLAAHPELSVAERLVLFAAAGRALAAAHAANVVHRDFKPDNVLVGEGGPRVTDFGLARPFGTRGGDAPPTSADARWMDSTATHGVHGTPAYMSPEQLDGREESDARSDQFSFGVALYEAVYRAHPFGLWLPGAPATLADLRQEMTRGPRRPASSDAPAWLWPVIERSLRVVPNERWPAMSALVDRLERPESEDPKSTRRLQVLSVALMVMCGLHLVTLAVLVAAIVTPDEPGQPTDTTWESVAGALLLLWGVFGAALAPLSALGLSRRRAWSLYTTVAYAIVSLPTVVGTPVAVLAIVVLSRADVRAALGAGQRAD